LKVTNATHVAYSLTEEKDKIILQILQTKYYSTYSYMSMDHPSPSDKNKIKTVSVCQSIWIYRQPTFLCWKEFTLALGPIHLPVQWEL